MASVEEELGEDGPLGTVAAVAAVIAWADSSSGDAGRAADRLARSVAASVDQRGWGARTMQAAFGLVRLSSRISSERASIAAATVERLASQLPGPAGAIAHAAALLIAGRATSLAAEAIGDPTLSRYSPQAFIHLTSVPEASSALFATWIRELERAAPHSGSTAFRAFLGDIAECAFRALQHGATIESLLGDDGADFLVDAICAELGGTTDFIAARGMTWLVGALALGDETARAAIERARARFHDAAFQRDCAAMLDTRSWPPLRR